MTDTAFREDIKAEELEGWLDDGHACEMLIRPHMEWQSCGKPAGIRVRVWHASCGYSALRFYCMPCYDGLVAGFNSCCRQCGEAQAKLDWMVT